MVGVCLATASCALVGCSNRESRESSPASVSLADLAERQVPGRVFLFGIDGARWDTFGGAMEAGVMPNLKRLTEAGARGVLESMDPTASAIIWTTIVTGKNADKHGIRGFVATSPGGKMVPVSSNMRKAKALWNMASEAGITVGFMSWWVSWPAERVRGFVCSDYTWPLEKDQFGFATGVNPYQERSYRTYPEDLIFELQHFIRTESDLSPAELEALKIDGIPKKKVDYAVRDILLKDVSLGRMTPYLLDRYRPSLFGVYFDGFDAYCHLYWPYYKHYVRARERGEEALADLAPWHRRLGEALDAHLTRIDACLGIIMDRAAPDDVVMVVSDHGYGDNPDNKPILRTYDDWIRPPHWHTLDGVFAVSGGPIRQSVGQFTASILDVTPTVLALLGMPVGRDMDGRVLIELFTEQFLARHPVQFIDTYETGERGGAPIESPYDEAMLDRLRSLGYVSD